MDSISKIRVNGTEYTIEGAPTSGSVESALGISSGNTDGTFLRKDGTWAVPTDNNTTYKFTIGTTTNGDSTNGVNLGTLKSETAAANGTTLSLVTTGEKATWNAKTSNVGTVTGVTVGTGGTNYTPTNGVVTIPAYPTSLPASDVSSWAKAANKPSYVYSEIGYNVTATTASGSSILLDGSNPVYVVTVSANLSSVSLSTNPAAGHSCHALFVTDSNDSNSYTISIANHSTNRVCPNGLDITLTVPASGAGYVEVDFLNVNNKVYVRGL